MQLLVATPWILQIAAFVINASFFYTGLWRQGIMNALCRRYMHTRKQNRANHVGIRH